MLQASLRTDEDCIATVYRSESIYIVKIRRGDGNHAMPRTTSLQQNDKESFLIVRDFALCFVFDHLPMDSGWNI